ncbi:MAG: hypothetical protein GY754_30255 [bacterium]|nr:hypothetical protein [bacterium]
MIPGKLLQKIISDFHLSLKGTHGLIHWARVFENGRMLCERNNARRDVVELFAVLHDSQRRSDMVDKDHGRRGARYAEELRGEFFELDDSGFELLVEACRYHNRYRKCENETIQTCWDSDRLDLGRVFIKPNPKYMYTPTAKDPGTIDWALDKNINNHRPGLIETEWNMSVEWKRGILGSLKKIIARAILK